MTLSSLTAISPIDGRYNSKTKSLQKYFSESALIKYRIKVEVEYFISLCQIPLSQLREFPSDKFNDLRNLYNDFSINSAKRIKEIESITNHDVKAVEYLIKEEFDNLGLSQFKEFIHFGLTSQDINNTAVPLSIKDAFNNVFFPELTSVLDKLKERSEDWKDIPMLARTHGQAASPTKLGKEIYVFVERAEKQIELMNSIPFSAKFGGATGNFNAHHVAFPKINWKEFGNNFVENSLGLKRQQTTTQIEHYDNLAALMDSIKRINNILIDLSRDIWTYVSMDYFKQSIKKGEVGSSAMPHKINPIDFENAEGNLAMANAIYEFLSSKLPISRLQRDLTDSTVLRNIGVPFAHNLIAFSSLNKGLEKLVLNEEKIRNDLDNNWAVCAEAIQTILRRESYPNPYESLKDLTRTNSYITQESLSLFINGLDVSEEIKEELRRISPFNYTGI
ncbi:MAG: adenylosuccinate lyase [Flavobacteriales bacterium]|nr:adenylosuccinate lyase [Flavobacteriales bacterium]